MVLCITGRPSVARLVAFQLQQVYLFLYVAKLKSFKGREEDGEGEIERCLKLAFLLCCCLCTCMYVWTCKMEGILDIGHERRKGLKANFWLSVNSTVYQLVARCIALVLCECVSVCMCFVCECVCI